VGVQHLTEKTREETQEDQNCSSRLEVFPSIDGDVAVLREFMLLSVLFFMKK
jgi:hypothetical protein